MKTIWKFKVDIEDETFVLMPRGAKILFAATQNIRVAGDPLLRTAEEILIVWAIIDPVEDKVRRRLFVVGTGHPIHDEMAELPFVGTVLMSQGELVFHLFDGGEV